MKKVHLVGSRGCLGTYLTESLRQLIPVVPYNTENFDITDKQHSILPGVQPGDIVIWNAAYTNVSDNDIEKHFKYNVEPIKRLTKDLPPVHFIYISSLYCQGDIDHLSAYSQTKSIAETIVKSHFQVWNIIRFSGLIGYDPGRKNMLYQFLDNDEMKFNPHLRQSIVYAGNIATWVLRTMIQQEPGVLEIGSEEMLNKEQVLINSSFECDLIPDETPDPIRPETVQPRENKFLYNTFSEIQAAVTDILGREDVEESTE